MSSLGAVHMDGRVFCLENILPQSLVVVDPLAQSPVCRIDTRELAATKPWIQECLGGSHETNVPVHHLKISLPKKKSF